MTVEVTPYLDADPCPRVEVFVSDPPAGTAEITIRRVAGGESMPVQGAVGVPGLSLTRMDHDIPFGVAVVYQAEYLGASGQPVAYESSAPVTLDVYETWMHNPLYPRGAVAVEPAATAAASLSRPANVQFVKPKGARRAVALSEPRGGYVGVNFDVIAWDTDTADRVQALLGSDLEPLPPVLCIRIGSRDGHMRIPRPFYLGVSEIVEQDIATHLGVTRQAMTGDETAPPARAVATVAVVVSNADISASFATNAEIDAAHRANSDIDRRYDLAGAAS